MLNKNEKLDINNSLINEQYYQTEDEQKLSIEKSITQAYQAKIMAQRAVKIAKKNTNLSTDEMGIDFLVDKKANDIKDDMQAQIINIFQEIENLMDDLIGVNDRLIDKNIQTSILQMLESKQNILGYSKSLVDKITTDIDTMEEMLREKRLMLETVKQGFEESKSAINNIERIVNVAQKIETLTERAQRLNDSTMVTVVCITYNHEKYLAKALDSFIMQKTNFKFKVFVGEDCSTDNTRQILREYADRYPDIIIPFYRDQNLGALENTYDLLMHLTSPFVAYCEGDDYWIDENKLQKQYNLMQEKPYLRVCFHNTEILGGGKYHASWYKKRPDGKQLIPDSFPNFNSNITEFDANYYINTLPAHTSSMFFRWNYDIQIPESFRTGSAGDNFMLLMQLGKGKIGFIKDLMSVYRRTDAGVTWENGDLDKRWLSTRLHMVEYLEGTREFFIKNYDGYAKNTLENKIKLESYNYLRRALDIKDYDAIRLFFEKYPEQAKIVLNAFLVFYQDSRLLTGCYTWDGYKFAVRNKWVRNSIKPYIKLVLKCKKLKDKIKKNKFLVGRVRKLLGFRSMVKYWVYALIPKQKNLWVFSTLLKKGYLDNCKYLYEYILENHPEIEAVWLTMDDSVVELLRKQNKPVYKMSSREGKRALQKAEVAIINNNRITDLENNFGFNAKTKVVQLWHGVGLKDMNKILNLTDFRHIGLVKSDDILVSEKDNFFLKIKKALRYIRHAHHRELFERYFMLVCPGKERIEKVADVWGLPEERCFMAGHPRDINLYLHQPDKQMPKILYAPTYRYDVNEEIKLAQECVSAYSDIQKLMEKIDGNFVIRIHPYTWHNYKDVFLSSISDYERISFDTSKDIYETLHQYTVMISDYSSIAFDFVVGNRPVVFHCPDLEKYLIGDCGITYDFAQVTPGPKTKTWKETLAAVEEYVANPNKDSEWRKEVGKYFFEPTMNDENNSERIVCEIKRRLGMMD